jgi:hypothetical protein
MLPPIFFISGDIMTSYHMVISTILDWMQSLSIRTILDVGVGFGKYGFLAREYLDIRFGREKPRTWQIEIYGLEPYKPFISGNPIIDYVYNNVFNIDADTFLKEHSLCNVTWDLVFMCDVLEHMEKEESVRILNEFRKRAVNVIVTVPIGPYPQGAIFNNPWEEHKSTWYYVDLEGYSKQFVSGTTTACLYQRF